MGNTWWAKVERLYHAARERSPGQRSRFLDEAVAGDSALLRQVEVLLEQDEKSGSFLDKPAITFRAMALTPGSRIGPYEVTCAIGAGSMGEVYRARDVRLKRDVAIKALPEEFAQDAERLARFQREAQILAALSHPNIASIYDVQESNGAQFLVLEFVGGDTLADIISKRGALPVDEALQIAKQICDAIDAAHDSGIIHRDLKPANIKIIPDGKVKVLDFGLAKAGTAPGTNVSDSPPLGLERTVTGVILGTAAYMSPEQARGLNAGPQSDIFSFGSVLFEMLTGCRAFVGETVPDMIAAILEREPDWRALPEDVPPAVRRLLARCLEKDPRRRLRDIGDARLDLDDTFVASAAPATPPSRHWRLRSRVQWVFLAAGLLFGALGGLFLLRREPAPPSQVLRLNIDLPQGIQLLQDQTAGAKLALSPDGKRLVMVGQEENGKTRLFVRSLDGVDATPIAGTDGARGPFVSPDSQWIGFSSNGRLQKIPFSGGEATVLCDGRAENGASWGANGIVFSSGRSLFLVPAEGGSPRQLTDPDPSKSENQHLWPSWMPGGKAILFTITHGNGRFNGDRDSAILSLDSGHWKTLVTGASTPKFINGGFLMVNQGTSLEVAPLDAAHLVLTESPKPLFEDDPSDAQRKDISYGVSESGESLVYASAPIPSSGRGIYMLDRQGRAELMSAELRSYGNPSLSPDGSKLAVNVQLGTNASEIWVFDLSHKEWARMTSGGSDWIPIWEPHSQNIIYGSGRTPASDIWNINVLDSGGGSPKLLTTFRRQLGAFAVSPDVASVIFAVHGASVWELWLQRLDAKSAAQPFLPAQLNKFVYPRAFSPDGRWLAYQSDVTGRSEVYVADFPGGTAWHPVSTGGGIIPVWSRGGQELFYWAPGGKMMAVPVKVKGNFEAGVPRTLFESPKGSLFTNGSFDVTPDGTHFVFVGIGETHTEPAHIVFVPDLSAALRRLRKPK
jgi:serine/threonine-protein kinase